MPGQEVQIMEPFISAGPEINVEEIMAAISKRIQEKKDSGLLKQRDIDEIAEMELLPLPDFQEIPNIYDPMLYPDFAGNVDPNVQLEEPRDTNPVKIILKKIRSLFAPMIRFIVRPMCVELKIDILRLQKRDRIILQSSEYIRLLHNTVHNMIVEMSKLKTEEELLKTKIKILEEKSEFLENRERALEKKLSS
jgi:hypothetical protein